MDVAVGLPPPPGPCVTREQPSREWPASRRGVRRRRRGGRALGHTAALVGVAVVASLQVACGPALREKAAWLLAGTQLQPPFHRHGWAAWGRRRLVERKGFLEDSFSWRSLFGLGDEGAILDERLRNRFESYAEGEGDEKRIGRKALRSLLECTDNFCLTKQWLPEETVEEVYNAYARHDGLDIEDFKKLSQDGLLLEGKLEEYQKAFDSLDKNGEGVLTRDELSQLFEGLGRKVSLAELDEMLKEGGHDFEHDGAEFDLADFLGLARKHLELKEVLSYVGTKPQSGAAVGNLASAPTPKLGEITVVHSEEDLNSLISDGEDMVVELAFTWCRPCKAFAPKYKVLSEWYTDTRFIKIVGNENESCKHYARDVLQAKISPMFAAYSKGELKHTWTGANWERFVNSVTEHLSSAGARERPQEPKAAELPVSNA